MAITTGRQIRYDDLAEYVEHQTGKKLRSWKQDSASLMTYFLFEDGTMGALSMGDMIENVFDIKPYDVPKSFCVSCGEEWHASSFDWQGRCGTTVRNFWKRVRKVYWHRYSKNK